MMKDLIVWKSYRIDPRNSNTSLRRLKPGSGRIEDAYGKSPAAPMEFGVKVCECSEEEEHVYTHFFAACRFCSFDEFMFFWGDVIVLVASQQF